MSVFNPLITQSLSVWYENVLLSPAFSTCFTSPSPFLSITPLTRVTFFYSSICHFKSPFPFPLGLFPSFLSSSLLTFTSGFLSPSSPLSHHLIPTSFSFYQISSFSLLFSFAFLSYICCCFWYFLKICKREVNCPTRYRTVQIMFGSVDTVVLELDTFHHQAETQS